MRPRTPMSSYLLDLVRNRKPDSPHGIYSVCSAHPWVLEASMSYAGSAPLLIEATCNQVNQFGGYTGMRPADFRDMTHEIAAGLGFPTERILLGGDHLGPFPWQYLDAETAMVNACEMVDLFVRAGYCKIHLDASMPCADDPRPLPHEVIAERAARLCAAAESAAHGLKIRPVYVIGTEVPTPGGTGDETHLSVTSKQDAEEALHLHRDAFAAAGLQDAWQRVIALVVQPGVEFSNDSVKDYDSRDAVQLASLLQQHSEIVFEAHSTDYQQPQALASLVQDGFRILKVGPGLTYAMRQTLFALAAIEAELRPRQTHSRLREQLEELMLAHPQPWQHHYSGTPDELHQLRVHSYSDRIRYYWANDNIQRAMDKLLANLGVSGIPETLLSDYLPLQYARLRAGQIDNHPRTLVLDAIGMALAPYKAACAPA